MHIVIEIENSIEELTGFSHCTFLQGCLKYVIRIPLKYELGYGLG